mgnify:FL=1
MAIRIHLGRVLGDRKLRAAAVSRKTGIATATLSALYNEAVSGIKFETLDKLCQELGCTVADLLEYVPGRKRKQ